MKKFYLSVMLLCGCVLLNGQSKIDMKGICALKQYEIQKRAGIDSRLSETDRRAMSAMAETETVRAIVTLTDGASIEALEENGAEVLDVRDNMAIVSLPIDKAEKFSEIKEIKKMSFGGKLYPKLDKARTASYVSRVHSGFGLSQKYTGAGVVAGLMDQGIDPNHITFFNSDGTESRVKRVWKMGTKIVSSYVTPSEIAAFTTDDSSETHGTHVAGIMAGAYKTENSYYGVATDADIAMAAGSFTDANVSLAISKIVDYAESEGKPAVVNLSMGSNLGPHDGTDQMCQYIDKLGENAIICVSAGNEGSYPIVLSKNFTSSDTQVKSFLVENYYEGVIVGGVDVWSSDSNPVTVTAVIYDTTTNEIIYSMPSVTKSTGNVYTYVANGSYYSSGDLKSTEFDKAFNGYMGSGSSVDSSNNRYNLYFNYYLITADTNTDGRYAAGLIIDGTAGQRVDAYCDGTYTEFTSHNVAGWSEGSTNGSINSMACGKNTIAVGSYNTKNSFTRLDGIRYGNSSMTVGDVSSFSSWGVLPDGRELPHITAPGCFIVSAISTPYVNRSVMSGDFTEKDVVASVSANNRYNYWDGMQGTSMSSPYAAGTIALWLQADPTLTVEDARSIAMETAITDSYVTNSSNRIQWGAGKINALDGIKKVLSNSNGIGSVKAGDDSNFVVSQVSESTLQAFVAGEAGLNATLYSMSGQPVLSASSTSDTVELDASGLIKGVYVLNVQGKNSNHSTRVLVK